MMLDKSIDIPAIIITQSIGKKPSKADKKFPLSSLDFTRTKVIAAGPAIIGIAIGNTGETSKGNRARRIYSSR